MQVLITTVCSLVAAICGAYIVHKLTRTRDHDIWVRDSRIKEWQELLDSLTRAYMTLLSHTPSGRKLYVKGEDTADVLADVDIVLSTRIFIADDVSSLNVRIDWAQAVSAYRADHNKPSFKDRFQRMRMSIVDEAKKTK